MSNAKLTSGINSDGGRGPQVTRQGKREINVWVRQLTWDNGMEADLTMFADGTVSVTVKHINSGEELLRWRSQVVDGNRVEVTR